MGLKFYKKQPSFRGDTTKNILSYVFLWRGVLRLLLTATKIGSQPLAVWRMVQRVASNTSNNTFSVTKMLIYSGVAVSATTIWLLCRNLAWSIV